MRTFTLLALLCVACAAHAQRTFDVTIGDSTYHLKKYWFVLYTKGDVAPLDSATSAATLKAHLAHQSEQAERGLEFLLSRRASHQRSPQPIRSLQIARTRDRRSES